MNKLLFFRKASRFSPLIASYGVRSFTREADDPCLLSYVILSVLSYNNLPALNIILSTFCP
ncbi:hypothetical protein EJD97_023092 [Solanum chilense]|uniref:Uncharacterized protein n=1 Tax=Solanum chilense TaxID=4083 RepID=A0A6N2AUQ4_SOLCI|nr:hypothetical protein EJD97_023092 [Solanum chilense]